MTDIKGRRALITGASKGIGKAIAKRFAQEGANLILAARSTDLLEKVDDEIKADHPDTDITLVPIDLTNPLQIEEMVRSIAQRFKTLDILVGNAGLLGTLTPITHQSPEEWTQVMAVNLNANWHLLRLSEALLKQSDAGRAVFVTSGVSKGPYPYWGAYGVSKMALEFMVKTVAVENESTSMKVNLVDPGVVRTDMRAQAMPGENPDDLPHPSEITDIFVELSSSSCQDNGRIFEGMR